MVKLIMAFHFDKRLIFHKGTEQFTLTLLSEFLLTFPLSDFPVTTFSHGFPGGSVVKNPPANAGNSGSIPGSSRSLEKEMATHSSIPA